MAQTLLILIATDILALAGSERLAIAILAVDLTTAREKQNTSVAK